MDLEESKQCYESRTKLKDLPSLISKLTLKLHQVSQCGIYWHKNIDFDTSRHAQFHKIWKWIKDLNVRGKAVQVLEEYIGDSLCDHGQRRNRVEGNQTEECLVFNSSF